MAGQSDTYLEVSLASTAETTGRGVKGRFQVGCKLNAITCRLLVSSALSSVAFDAAQAVQCMGAAGAFSGGAPSISATDVSTTQALELIRQRREQQTSALQSSGTNPDTDSPAAPSSEGGKTKAGKQTKQTPATEQMESASSSALRAAWIQGYVDYERHKNIQDAPTLNPNTVIPQNTVLNPPGLLINPTRTQVSEGVVGGADQTYFLSDASTLQLGVFGGYNHTRNEYSDSAVVSERVDLRYSVTETLDASEKIQGGMIGAYGALTHGNFAADLVFKVDLFDFSQKGVKREVDTCDLTPPFDPEEVDGKAIVTPYSGSTRQTDYIIAPNVYYRMPVNAANWIEPTLGVRYTYTDFGSGAGALGLEDGQAFRVQGGLRIGTAWTDTNFIWTASLLGLLYSDVFIDGFTNGLTGLPGGSAKVDEDKLRALGRFNINLQDNAGNWYFLQTEVRGGEDVIGVGGQIGYRYEW